MRQLICTRCRLLKAPQEFRTKTGRPRKTCHRCAAQNTAATLRVQRDRRLGKPHQRTAWDAKTPGPKCAYCGGPRKAWRTYCGHVCAMRGNAAKRVRQPRRLQINKKFGAKVPARSPRCELHHEPFLMGTDGNGVLLEWCPICRIERKVGHAA
jgi:hypothetical protein